MLYRKPNIYILEYNTDLSKMIYNIENKKYIDKDSAVYKKLAGILDLKRWQFEFSELYQDYKLYNSKMIFDMNNRTNKKIRDAIFQFNEKNREDKLLYFLDSISDELSDNYRSHILFPNNPFLFDLEKFIYTM
jgi:hypothetical protein